MDYLTIVLWFVIALNVIMSLLNSWNLRHVRRLRKLLDNCAAWVGLTVGWMPPPKGMNIACPGCDARKTLIPGPRAGIMTNIICLACGRKYNIAPTLGYIEETGRDENLAADLRVLFKLRGKWHKNRPNGGG